MSLASAGASSSPVGTGVHAHAVGRTAHGQRLAQIRGVDRRAGLDLEPVAPLREKLAPVTVAALYTLSRHIPVDHLKVGSAAAIALKMLSATWGSNCVTLTQPVARALAPP